MADKEKILSAVKKVGPLVGAGMAEAYSRGGVEGLKEDTKIGLGITAAAKVLTKSPQGRALGRGLLRKLGFPAAAGLGAFEAGQATRLGYDIATKDLPKVSREQKAMKERYGTIEAAKRSRREVQAKNREKAERFKKSFEKHKGTLALDGWFAERSFDALMKSDNKYWADIDRLKARGYTNHLIAELDRKDESVRAEYPGVYKKGLLF